MRSTDRFIKHTESNQNKLAQFKDHFERIEQEIQKHVIGQKSVIRQSLYCIFAGGHILLEGLPGLGKTTLAKAISRSLGLPSKRIQFTPDLMPADIIGTSVIEQNPNGGVNIKFNEGPLFTSICLADEINRTTPKTQSALLEAMQEGRVTISGETKILPDIFCVMATQNPIELEGTYPLPEAQLDRFLFKIKVEKTSIDDLIQISDLTTVGYKPSIKCVIQEEEIVSYRSNIFAVLVPEYIKRYAARIVRASDPTNEEATPMVKKYVNYGSSPRGLQSIILSAKVAAAAKGEITVSEKEIHEVVAPCLRHRIILNFEGEANQINQDQIIKEVMKEIIVIPEKELQG